MKDKTKSILYKIVVILALLACVFVIIMDSTDGKENKDGEIGTEEDYTMKNEESTNYVIDENNEESTHNYNPVTDNVEEITTEEYAEIRQEKDETNKEQQKDFDEEVDLNSYNSDISYDETIESILNISMSDEDNSNIEIFCSIDYISKRLNISTTDIKFDTMKYNNDSDSYDYYYNTTKGSVIVRYDMENSKAYAKFITEGEIGADEEE